jgi:hypothetical protein
MRMRGALRFNSREKKAASWERMIVTQQHVSRGEDVIASARGCPRARRAQGVQAMAAITTR